MEVSGQSADRVDINLLRPRSKSVQFHVGNHAAAQFSHGISPVARKLKASSNRKPIPARLSSGPQQRAENEKCSPTSRALRSIKRETTAGTHNADCRGKTPHYRAAISSNDPFWRSGLSNRGGLITTTRPIFSEPA